MTLILHNTVRLEFHTDMGEIVKPIREDIKMLNWILTYPTYSLFDWEEKGPVDKLYQEAEVIHYDGSELLEILENRRIQFIWGIFCGSKKKIDNISQDKIPNAALNKEIWTNPDMHLLPDSEIEVICFDSTVTLIKFRDKRLEKRWRMKFSDSRILEKSAS